MDNEIEQDNFVQRLRQMEREYDQGRRWSRKELLELYPFYGGKAEKFNPSISLEKRIAKLKVDALRTQSARNRQDRTYTFGRKDLSEQVNTPIWMDSIMTAPIYAYSEKWSPEKKQKHQTQFAERVEEAMEDDEIFDLAIDIAEMAHANPQLSEVLPLTSEQHCSSTASERAQSQAQIEIWNETGYMATVYGVDMKAETEIMEALPCGITERYLDEHRSYRNIKRSSNFKVEEAERFPIDGDCFPDIIDRIESNLNCQDIWHFRVAFKNVSTVRKKRKSRTFIKEIEQNSQIQNRVACRKCLCNTQLYEDPHKLFEYGMISRKLFNYRIKFARSNGYSCKILCAQKISDHTIQYDIHNYPMAVYKPQMHKCAWYYTSNSLKIQSTKQVYIDKVRVECGQKKFRKKNLSLDDPYWNTVVWDF